MQHMTIDNLGKDLRTAFTRVSDDREPLAITLDENRAVVVVDFDDYDSLMETLFLGQSLPSSENP